MHLGVFPQWESHVFKNAKVVEQRAVLKQHAHALARLAQTLVRKPGNVLAEYMNGALLRRDLPGCRAQQRGLARARAAHHGDHLPAPDLKVDALQHREVAIDQRDIGEAYKGRSEERRVGNEGVSTCRTRW